MLLPGFGFVTLNLFIGDTYNRYICPLQPCRHLTLKLFIQGHPRSAKVPYIEDFKSAYIPLIQGQTRIPKLKSPYNSLIIGPRVLQCDTNL